MMISCPMVEKSKPRPGKYPNLNVEKVGTHCRSEDDSPSIVAASGAGLTRVARCFSSSANLRRNCSTLGGRNGASRLLRDSACGCSRLLSDTDDITPDASLPLEGTGRRNCWSAPDIQVFIFFLSASDGSN